MSAEEAVTDARQAPLEQNAQSAEEVKKMLAELQDQSEASGQTKETNGTSATVPAADKVHSEENVPEKDRESATAEQGSSVQAKDAADKPRARRQEGRSDRGSGRPGRGRGGYQARNYRDNIKSDLTAQEESSDPVAIRKQVEFYFSDSNLPNDKFLLSKVGGSQNHPVELKILHSFKRMRHFQPFSAIVDAMRESKFLELTDNDTCVRRREPLPESLNDGPDPDAIRVFEDRAMPRSIYAKGFGDEVPSTQFDIEAFFAPYGPTNAVRLRRSETKHFKGSVFVEFESEDLQKAFLALDPKPKFQGRDLQIVSKKEYCDKKVEDIKSGKIKPNNQSKGRRYDDKHGNRDGKRKRDDEDDRDWRTRREEDRKNGFKDDKRRDHRGRDGRGGKKFERVERDHRGVPLVKATAEDEGRVKRDSERAEAIAKAKAVVEAQNEKENQESTDTVESAEQEGGASGEVAHTIPGNAETAGGKKRTREEDEDDVEREVKKLDSKAETVPVSGSS